MNNKYKAQIDSVLHYINQQILKDWSDMASDAFNKATQGDILAREACMSSRNFQLYFKLYLKESFGEYVDRVRRDLALQLIQEGRYTYTEIAERIENLLLLGLLFVLNLRTNNSHTNTHPQAPPQTLVGRT